MVVIFFQHIEYIISIFAGFPFFQRSQSNHCFNEDHLSVFSGCFWNFLFVCLFFWWSGDLFLVASTIMYLSVEVFSLILLGIHRASWSGFMSFINFEKFSAVFSICYFCSFSLYSNWYSNYLLLNFVPIFVLLSSLLYFSILLFLYTSFWVFFSQKKFQTNNFSSAVSNLQ